MMGAFAEWQPRYAEQGVATFPVAANKVPTVKGYLKINPEVSSQLAIKFPDNDAFGFVCRQARITILDVDTPDERVLEDALARHGSTPFIVRSGSGNYQAWYRHNGEKRQVRPDLALPIDILGDGYVVAPPSRGTKGKYQIIQGSLDDLCRLPTMSLSVFDPNNKHTPLPASPAPVLGQFRTDGMRNEMLWRQCMLVASDCRNVEELVAQATAQNQRYCPPLSDDEVMKIAASAWKYEEAGRNWFGQGRRVAVEHWVVDDLAAANPRAFALLGLLMRHHWGREFFLCKAFASELGWSVNTLRAARDALAERGLIECHHAGGRGPNDPPIYKLAKVGGV